MKPGGDVYYLK